MGPFMGQDAVIVIVVKGAGTIQGDEFSGIDGLIITGIGNRRGIVPTHIDLNRVNGLQTGFICNRHLKDQRFGAEHIVY